MNVAVQVTCRRRRQGPGVPLATVTSPFVKPVTASEKVNVTIELLSLSLRMYRRCRSQRSDCWCRYRRCRGCRRPSLTTASVIDAAHGDRAVAFKSSFAVKVAVVMLPSSMARPLTCR